MKRGFLAILLAVVMQLISTIPIATPILAANPNSKVTITPASGQVAANASFVLTITEQNTGNENLTNVYVNVWSILATTNINYYLGYPSFPPTFGDGLNPQTLDIGETWTWDIPGVVLNPGVTVISALGHGLDQSGNPIAYPSYPDEYYSVDLTAVIIDNDLGDAPDSTNHVGVTMTTGYTPNNQANFPTVYNTLSPGPPGPFHINPKGFAWLGPQVSFENEADTGWDQDGVNNINPPGAANQDLSDDSITSVYLPACQLTRFIFSSTNASNITPVNAYVNVWFDWTLDGDWDDQPRCAIDPSTTGLAPEWAVQNYLVALAPGFNPGLLTPFFRSLNSPGQTIWMRITLTDVPISDVNNGGPFLNPVDLGKGGSGPVGGYQFGETEDYLILPSVGITVDIDVILQGSSRPETGWVIPLTVKFFTPGSDVMISTPIYTFNLTTIKAGGYATVQCTGVVPGNYDITAVSEHTLLNVKRNVEITTPTNPVTFGTLLEGNANNDDRINIQDFGTLANAYGKLNGNPLYNPMSDFDRNDGINIFDFGLLATNYLKIAPIELP